MSKGVRQQRGEASSLPFATAPREPVDFDRLSLAKASDIELMQAIAEGQESAFEELYSRFAPQVYAVCLRVLHRHGDAEGILTEVLWEIWNRADRYNPTLASPRTYIMMLSRSRAIDRKRILSKQALHIGEAESDIEAIAATHEMFAPANSMIAAEDYAHLRLALQQLSQEQRDTISLAYFDGLTHCEIAERLDKPLGTVKTHIRQAIIRLRKTLRAGSRDRREI